MLIRSRTILGVLFAAALLLHGIPVRGATTATARYVSIASGADIGKCTSATSPCKTISYALTQAKADDTINIACGVYVENVTVAKSVTLKGISSKLCVGTNDAIISPAEGIGVLIENDSTVTMTGLVIANGITGVETREGSTALLTNMTIRDNVGLIGILNRGTLTISDSVIYGNTTGLVGGDITNFGTMTINSSTISGNTSAQETGGITNWATMTINNSAVSGHTNGLGIYNVDTMTINNSTISGNTNSGGIHNNGTLTINNSTISNNDSGFKGGGIYNRDTVMLTNSTIVANTADEGGGGIFNAEEGVVHMHNVLVALNTTGGDCHNDGGTFQAFDANLDSDGSCSGFSLSGQNPLLGPLQDNGGPTLTRLPDSSSPAVDAGSNDACATVGDLDQRGLSRLDVDGNGDPGDGNACDVGAVERQAAATPLLARAGGPYSGNEGAPILLDGSGSQSDSGLTGYAWDCTDDGVFDVYSTSPTGSSCTYADNGSFTVHLLVTDAGDLTDTDTGVVTVLNVAPMVTPPSNQGASEGVSTMFGLGSFADPGADDPWGVTIAWGDGSTDTRFAVNSSGPLTGQSHTYATSGDYTVRVSVNDGEESGSATFQVTVSTVPPSTGTVSGKVVDGSGAGIEDAQVTLTGEGGALSAAFVQTQSTDANGAYVFDHVPAGVCSLTVEAEGYQPSDPVVFTVGEGEAVGLDPVILQEKGIGGPAVYLPALVR